MSDEPLNPKASFWGGARESGVDNLSENPSLAQRSLRFPPKNEGFVESEKNNVVNVNMNSPSTVLLQNNHLWLHIQASNIQLMF